MFHKTILTIMCIGFLLGNSSVVSAQTVNPSSVSSLLSVSPIIIDIPMVPGTTQRYPITVTNLYNESLGIHTAAQAFSPDGQGDGIIVLPEKNLLTTWSTLSDQDFILAPGESRAFTLSISVPSLAEKKGYYEVIFLTPFYARNDAVTQPSVLTKIGVVVLGRIGGINYTELQKKVAITSFEFDKVFYELPPVLASFRVANTYFTHFDAKPSLTITPLFGKPFVVPLPDKHILPGSTRRWDEKIILPKYSSIFYSAHLTVSLGDGKKLSKDTFFIMFPLKQMLEYGGLLIGFLVLILFRRRLFRAILILFKGNR